MYRKNILSKCAKLASLTLCAIVIIGLSGSYLRPPAAIAAAQCIRVGIAEPFTEAGDLDPYVRVSNSGDVMYIINNVYERLLDIGEDFKLIPKLAESWEHNADA